MRLNARQCNDEDHKWAVDYCRRGHSSALFEPWLA